MNSTNAANRAKPRGKPFTGKDDPRRSNSGQRNRAAVAFTRTLRELIVAEGERKLATPDGKQHKKAELMVRQLWAKAIAGEAWAVNIILDRTEGKVTERAEITGANGGPIETKDVSLTDEQRIIRIAALLDAARTRRDGPATGNTG